MKKIKIITDSNSGILQSEAKDLDIFVIPMPFLINGEEYLEEISISQEKFYEFLSQNAEVSTSQPSPFYLEELWEDTLKRYDEIVYIPMTSGLSGTYSTASALAEKYKGKVFVVDNRRISVTMKQSVYEAISLVKEGKSAAKIKSILEEEKDLQAIFICVNDLKYLKKGGRISPAAATVGALLKIKPILSSRGGKFEKFGVAMSMGQAKKKLVMELKRLLETEFKQQYDNGEMQISVAHTNNLAEAESFKQEILNGIPNITVQFVDPLSLSVSCHIGPGALGIAIHNK